MGWRLGGFGEDLRELRWKLELELELSESLREVLAAEAWSVTVSTE